jgi:hypothetical protein
MESNQQRKRQKRGFKKKETIKEASNGWWVGGWMEIYQKYLN